MDQATMAKLGTDILLVEFSDKFECRSPYFFTYFSGSQARVPIFLTPVSATKELWEHPWSVCPSVLLTVHPNVTLSR